MTDQSGDARTSSPGGAVGDLPSSAASASIETSPGAAPPNRGGSRRGAGRRYERDQVEKRTLRAADAATRGLPDIVANLVKIASTETRPTELLKAIAKLESIQADGHRLREERRKRSDRERARTEADVELRAMMRRVVEEFEEEMAAFGERIAGTEYRIGALAGEIAALRAPVEAPAKLPDEVPPLVAPVAVPVDPASDIAAVAGPDPSPPPEAPRAVETPPDTPLVRARGALALGRSPADYDLRRLTTAETITLSREFHVKLRWANGDPDSPSVRERLVLSDGGGILGPPREY